MSECPTLRRDDTSADGWVEYLQQLLTVPALALGHSQWPDTPTGVFDELTETVVRGYQEHCHLLVDGVVGDQTWAALRRDDPMAPATDGREPHSFTDQGTHVTVFQEPGIVFGTWTDGTRRFASLLVNTGTEPIAAGSETANGLWTLDGSSFEAFDMELRCGEMDDQADAAAGEMLSFWGPEMWGDLEGEYEVTVNLPAAFGGRTLQARLRAD